MTFREKLDAFHTMQNAFIEKFAPDNRGEAMALLSKMQTMAMEIQKDILDPSVTLG